MCRFFWRWLISSLWKWFFFQFLRESTTKTTLVFGTDCGNSRAVLEILGDCGAPHDRVTNHASSAGVWPFICVIESYIPQDGNPGKAWMSCWFHDMVTILWFTKCSCFMIWLPSFLYIPAFWFTTICKHGGIAGEYAKNLMIQFLGSSSQRIWNGIIWGWVITTIYNKKLVRWTSYPKLLFYYFDHLRDVNSQRYRGTWPANI